MGCGDRKAAASCGTLVAPIGALRDAATIAGNLPPATPIRGARSPGTALSRAFTNRASPPYIASRPSSPT